ncbi:MAG: hypothetical protein HY869_08360 [Chloroflexi bacterium]|nr:hypothetical protein [Chloroflexota bacterium]
MTQNSLSTLPYLKNLQSDPEKFQIAIEGLLEKYKVQPVGNGYIDLIVDKDISLALVHELTKLTVAIERLTWWCHVTSETKNELGCPHGMGGPQNKFGKGWFSECVGHPDFVVLDAINHLNKSSMLPEIFSTKSNEVVANYIKNIFPSEGFYSPCLYVGLWLCVPDDWTRKFYWP